VASHESVGKPFSSLFDNSKLKAQAKDFLNADESSSHQKDFNLNLSDAKTPRIVQARSSRLSSKNGEHSGVVILLRDVTRERELDQLKSEFIS
ncbi:MAG: hypothetical protein GWO08_10250, partial [Gammaproteobacteria bacterium]|nr:hypothetical protein [Gammaproteobacteria bacterium]NIR94029.1 hypothetical protein [Gammaproteobacteria bacterium]